LTSTVAGTADAGQSVTVDDWGRSRSPESSSIAFIGHLLDTARRNLYTMQVTCMYYK
jgi:hypothetical protein